MFVTIGAAMLAAISTAVIVRIRECHFSVNDLVRDLEGFSSRASGAQLALGEALAPTSSSPADVLFTESLLALSKVGLRAHDGSPEPAPAEASLLVSVRPGQSKTRVLVP